MVRLINLFSIYVRFKYFEYSKIGVYQLLEYYGKVFEINIMNVQIKYWHCFT